MTSALKRSLHVLSYTLGISHRLSNRRVAARVIMFHGVGPKPLTGRTFSSILIYLKKHYEIVSLHSLIQNQSVEGAKIKVALTFDDGLKNNYTTAYPILKKLEIPATFFVCPGLIEKSEWLWNHQARARISRLSESQISSIKNEFQEYGYEKNDIVEWMKATCASTRNEVCNLLKNRTPSFCPTSEEKESYDIMSSGELLKLDPNLISIGSHTKSHPILSQLESKALSDEIENSKSELENMIKRPVPHFCYPNGNFTDEAVKFVQEHYEAAVTTEKGLFAPDCNHFKIPRIGATGTVAYQAWRMWRPGA